MRLTLCGVAVLVLAACPGPEPKTVDMTPPSAPTQQRAEVRSDGTVEVSWTNSSDGDLSRVLVARFLAGGSALRPDGTPAVGDAIGTGGTVVFLGLASQFVDATPPSTCGAISYRLWSQDSQGRWSIDQALVELPAGATNPVPSQGIDALTAAARGQVLTVQWTNPPPSSGFFQVALVRKPGSAPGTPTDGVPLLTGTSTTFVEDLSGFAPGERLFYAAFSCNACGRCRQLPTFVSFTVPDVGAPDAGVGDGGVDAGVIDAGVIDAGVVDAGVIDAGVIDAGSLTPTGLTATLSTDGQRVQLAWTNGTNGALARVRVSRTLTSGGSTSAPVVVFEGPGTSATERVDQLLPSVGAAQRSYTYQAVGCSSATCEAGGPTASLSLTLKQALRGGGYTVFWRHASAAVCSDRTDLCPVSLPPGQTCAQALVGTSSADWWKTCLSDAPACTTTARQLSTTAANAETTAVRTWFTANGVTVGRVLTSEYCRCFTTAQDFQFGPALEYSPDLTYWVYEEGLRCAKNVALLHQTPATGTNTAMVGHAGFSCPTLDSLAWGEAAIFKPQAPTSRTCTTVGSCAADEACVSGQCVKPLFIARVPALGGGSWSTLP
jgi:phosphohistidine phosphatase SixA